VALSRGVEDGPTEQTVTKEKAVGFLDVNFCFAVDVSVLFGDADKDENWRQLLAHRLGDKSTADTGKMTELSSKVSVEVYDATNTRNRMGQAKLNHGKAIWTEHFLESESPLRLTLASTLPINGAEIKFGDRVPALPGSDLRFAKFHGHSMNLFREGTLTYTVRFNLVGHPKGGSEDEPLNARRAVMILKQLETESWSIFSRLLTTSLSMSDAPSVIEELVGVSKGLTHNISAEILERKAKLHKLLFLQCFLEETPDGWIPILALDAVREAELGGLLNTADWFNLYRENYVKSLAAKDIGYRSDEIYITDRKASIASNEGFWDVRDPLHFFRDDLVLAVEYWIVRLSQTHAFLKYMQDHPDIRSIADHSPDKGLDVVVQAMRALARLEESMDPSRIIDHGFSAMFMTRLRQEMGIDPLLAFARDRLSDAITSIGLRSSVQAEKITSGLQVRLTVGLIVVGVATVVVTMVTLLPIILGIFYPTSK